MWMLKNKKGCRGFSLTELAVVLGLVGVVTGAIWVAASAVYRNARIKTASDQMGQIAQNVRALHALQTTIDAAVTQTQWIAHGVFPADMVVGTGGSATTLNRWGGVTRVDVANVNGTNGDGFIVSFGAVPQSDCIDFVVRNAGQSRDTGLVGVTASQGNGASAGTSNNSLTFPLNATTVTGICQYTGVGTSANVVTFTFRLKG